MTKYFDRLIVSLVSNKSNNVGYLPYAHKDRQARDGVRRISTALPNCTNLKNI